MLQYQPKHCEILIFFSNHLGLFPCCCCKAYTLINSESNTGFQKAYVDLFMITSPHILNELEYLKLNESYVHYPEFFQNEYGDPIFNSSVIRNKQMKAYK